jgi:hypothetical protein
MRTNKADMSLRDKQSIGSECEDESICHDSLNDAIATVGEIGTIRKRNVSLLWSLIG